MPFTGAVRDALTRFHLQARGAAPLPRQPSPMLLERARELSEHPDWTYEPKWDGFRVLAGVRGGAARLVSRNGHSFTNLFGAIADALRGFPTSILLDGEVVCINEEGRPDFEALQQRLRPQGGTPPGYLCYMVFDCLHVNGHSLLDKPLEERQAILRAMQPALQYDAVKLTDGFPAGKARRLIEACAMMGLEGIVMKRQASVYRPGARSTDWLKVPFRHREEFVVGGYLSGPLGFSTLILGQYDSGGRLVYAGSCGTGLSDATRAAIFEELQEAHRNACPFPTVPVLRDRFREPRSISPQWVRPSVVVEVEYRQRLKDGLRHAALKGLRPEKRPGQIRRSPTGERGSS